jgi:hypothetical protein
MSRFKGIRRAAGLTAVAVTTVAVSVGGVATPAQALPPSPACGHVLRMHHLYLQRANAAAHVTAPTMIWAATANARWHEAAWYYYWESMQVADVWADVATQLGCLARDPDFDLGTGAGLAGDRNGAPDVADPTSD